MAGQAEEEKGESEVMEEEAVAVEEVMEPREVLVILAVSEMLGSPDVVATLTALGMLDIVEEARVMVEMEQHESHDISDIPEDDPEPDDLPEPSDLDDGEDA